MGAVRIEVPEVAGKGPARHFRVYTLYVASGKNNLLILCLSATCTQRLNPLDYTYIISSLKLQNSQLRKDPFRKYSEKIGFRVLAGKNTRLLI